jgi:hypothetical protein
VVIEREPLPALRDWLGNANSGWTRKSVAIAVFPSISVRSFSTLAWDAFAAGSSLTGDGQTSAKVRQEAVEKSAQRVTSCGLQRNRGRAGRCVIREGLADGLGWASFVEMIILIARNHRKNGGDARHKDSKSAGAQQEDNVMSTAYFVS